MLNTMLFIIYTLSLVINKNSNSYLAYKKQLTFTYYIKIPLKTYVFKTNYNAPMAISANNTGYNTGTNKMS